MRSEAEIKERLKRHRDDRDRGWREPDGYLVPTEPDPDERRRIRARLTVAEYLLCWVLGDNVEFPP